MGLSPLPGLVKSILDRDNFQKSLNLFPSTFQVLLYFIADPRECLKCMLPNYLYFIEMKPIKLWNRKTTYKQPSVYWMELKKSKSFIYNPLCQCFMHVQCSLFMSTHKSKLTVVFLLHSIIYVQTLTKIIITAGVTGYRDVPSMAFCRSLYRNSLVRNISNKVGIPHQVKDRDMI